MDNSEAIEKLEAIVLEHENELYSADIIAEKILAAFQDDLLGFFPPKPLEWVKIEPLNRHSMPEYIAKTPFGEFEVGENRPEWGERKGWHAVTPTHIAIVRNASTLEAAKAAAETHRNEMLTKEFI